MSAHRTLLLGAGNSRVKKIHLRTEPETWAGELVTIDMNPNCGADIVHDLSTRPLPFDAESFDEIHAYDCIEHWGVQGDWRGWFDEMAEYHRLLKPGGRMYLVVPAGEDRFADPGHTRFIGMNHFAFLNQAWYDTQIAAGKPVTDYRWYWKHDFLPTIIPGENHFAVVLQKQ